MAEADAHNAYLYFLPKGKIKGETTDEDMAAFDAFDVLSFDMSGENRQNIGSEQGGGKVKFENFKVKKRTDSATCNIFKEMCADTKFTDAILVIRRDNRKFMELTFKQVSIAEFSIAQEGDEESIDELTLDYGAVKIQYYMLVGNQAKLTSEAYWSRVKQAATLAV
ncbi:MAG: type VI secretion system tube protein Hcp [Pikeienuella sp.]